MKHRCAGTTRNGDPCRNNAIPKSRFCYRHNEDGVSRGRRLVNFATNHPFFVMLSVFGSVVSIITAYWYLRDQTTSAYSGQLAPATFIHWKYLSVGNTRFAINGIDGAIFRDGELPLLSLRATNGQLLVSTVIFDSRGDMVAELKDNEWSVNKNAAYDRNYTSNALECRDNRGNVVLQVVSLGDTVHVAGVFRCRTGKSLTLAPAESGAEMEFSPPNKESTLKIRPIFDYPSSLHFGVCPGLDHLSQRVKDWSGFAYQLNSSVDICVQPK